MPINYPSNYNNNFDESKNYCEMVFLNEKALAGNDANNFQSIVQTAIKKLSRTILKDGDLIEGGVPNINTVNGATTVSAGKIYVDGQILSFSDVTGLTIPTQETELGVFLDKQVYGYAQDATLVDPSINLITSGQETQKRIKYILTWGWKRTDDVANSGNVGVFYPVHLISNRVLVLGSEAPGLSLVETSIANYDKDANGGLYVIEGLDVNFFNEDASNYAFSVRQGKARIEGFPIKRLTSEEFSFTKDPDTELVQNESKVQTVVSGEATITTNNSPISSVSSVIAKFSKTESVTRGVTANTSDNVNENGIYQIDTVSQGATTYTQGVDYQLTLGQINWSLGGIEPAGGTSYNVTYRFTKSVGAVSGSITNTTFKIANLPASGGNLINGETCLVNYLYKLKRIDLLELTKKGLLQRVKGVPKRNNPQRPYGSTGNLPLAVILLDWINSPVVSMVAPKRIEIGELNLLRDQVIAQGIIIHELAQANQMNIIDPNSKYAVFVDNFMDNSQQDLGRTNTAKLCGGMLALPITQASYNPTEVNLNNRKVNTLPYTLVPIVSQEKQTGQVKINAYNSFEELPRPITIYPLVNNDINQYSESFLSRGVVPPSTPVNIGTDDVTSPVQTEPSLGIVRAGKITVTPPPSSWDQALAQATNYLQENRANPNKTTYNTTQQQKIVNLAASLQSGENVASIKINGKPVTVNVI